MRHVVAFGALVAVIGGVVFASTWQDAHPPPSRNIVDVHVDPKDGSVWATLLVGGVEKGPVAIWNCGANKGTGDMPGDRFFAWQQEVRAFGPTYGDKVAAKLCDMGKEWERRQQEVQRMRQKQQGLRVPGIERTTGVQ